MKKREMKIGYSYWGFLGDCKANYKGEMLSTPDGNAFYSWSIIKAFVDAGIQVISVMPDRDKFAFASFGKKIFSAWCTDERSFAYANMKKSDFSQYERDYRAIMKDAVFDIWNKAGLQNADAIIHEWRMKIPGRNDEVGKTLEEFQPDLYIQEYLIEYCRLNKIKLIIFDLDYKLEKEQFKSLSDIASVIELGTKWTSDKEFRDKSKKVYIPFDFDCINEFTINDNPTNNLIYVGNRYERDWCIDKYIPEDIEGCTIYGNWKESGRDSEYRWPKISFGKRLQTSEMRAAYSNSICTVLLAKEEYCEHNFMTARLIESVFYGTVPLFIEEYGKDTIKEYAGMYSEFLTVTSKEDVKAKIDVLKENALLRRNIIKFLRIHLKKMNAKMFVQNIVDML